MENAVVIKVIEVYNLLLKINPAEANSINKTRTNLFSALSLHFR